MLAPLLVSSASAADVVVGLNVVGVMGMANLNMGRMGPNAEVLFGDHGVLLEAGGIHLHGDPSHLWAYGPALSYRRHFGGVVDAPFMGLRVAAERGWGRYLLDEAAADPKAPDVNVELALTQLSATGHLGYRWSLGQRLTLTFRIGGGYAHRSIESTEDHARAAEALDFSYDRWARVPVMMDSELSLGLRL